MSATQNTVAEFKTNDGWIVWTEDNGKYEVASIDKNDFVRWCKVFNGFAYAKAEFERWRHLEVKGN